MEKWTVKTVVCEENMCLAEHLMNPFGVVIVPAGTPLTPGLKITLAAMGIDRIPVCEMDSKENSWRRNSA
ncbi:hypothetical protein [Anoxynatronum buryatiense]|uniref:Uncharacterized protein n=1 Tax=Anoxynatronum buryatiense TaxID=489973 RepID=A0AA45WV88_9CLOT|nr:hypothetical protein [Anoxynatronum buryatiense]SMP51782.1 hypothetical protein SAMN06296020_104126 [Anoxynatronum buryatiense]